MNYQLYWNIQAVIRDNQTEVGLRVQGPGENILSVLLFFYMDLFIILPYEYIEFIILKYKN